MKRFNKLLILAVIISSCGSYRTKTVAPTVPNTDLVLEDTNPFTNVFSFSGSSFLDPYKRTTITIPGIGGNITISCLNGVKRSDDVTFYNICLGQSDPAELFIKRTFADFFFYNQIVLTVPSAASSTGVYGVDAMDYFLSDNPLVYNPLGNEEKAYWSSTQIVDNQTALSGLDIINSIAPMELPSIDEIILKVGLAIDDNGYIDKTVGRILVGLVGGEDTLAVRLDLYSMTVTSNANSKDISAVFSDSCATVNFKGTMTTNAIGERLINDVSVTFINNSSSYKNTACLYNGSFKRYGNGSPSIDNINFPYTTSGTANFTNNINPYKVVIKNEANTKKRVLFNGVSMNEIVE